VSGHDVTHRAARRRRVFVGGLAVAGVVVAALVAPSISASAATPTTIRITSVLDASLSPVSPTPIAGRKFAVRYSLLDAKGNLAGGTATKVTLGAGSGPGSLAPVTTGGLTVTTGAGGTGTFTVTYSKPVVGLKLTAAATGLTSSSTTITVASVGVTATGTPGTALTLGPISVGTSTVTATLSKGALGTVALYSEPIGLCPAKFGVPTTAQCETVTLFGTFKTSAGAKLYSNTIPVKVTFTCTVTNCPKQGSGTYDPTLDYTAFPLQVALKTTSGSYTTFAAAPSCVALPNANRLTGALRSAAAQAAGFCADTYAFTRNASSTLTRPILFVEDPRFTPISR